MKWKPVFLKHNNFSHLSSHSFDLDILMIYLSDGHMVKNKLFLKDLNEFHPNLKFTFETSQSCVNYLDLNVSLKDGAIFTDLYMKPTEGHQFLH